MRINVYSEEMASDIELVTKEGVIGADGQPTTFYGVRFYLATPDVMHQTEHDDDRSAVTFWMHDTPTDVENMLYRLQGAYQAVKHGARR